MKKGIGPRDLGAPKTMAHMKDAKAVGKQVKNEKQNYYNLRPSDARTYADSAAVENAYFSGPRMGEVAGKIASGGKLNGNDGFTTGNTPNSADAKSMLSETRAIHKKHGKDWKKAYNR